MAVPYYDCLALVGYRYRHVVGVIAEWQLPYGLESVLVYLLGVMLYPSWLGVVLLMWYAHLLYEPAFIVEQQSLRCRCALVYCYYHELVSMVLLLMRDASLPPIACGQDWG